jgi:hypothetical protein
MSIATGIVKASDGGETSFLGVRHMGSTSFELFFLPLFQGFAFWFLVMAAARLLLDSAVRSWRRRVDRDHEPWG